MYGLIRGLLRLAWGLCFPKRFTIYPRGLAHFPLNGASGSFLKRRLERLESAGKLETFER